MNRTCLWFKQKFSPLLNPGSACGATFKMFIDMNTCWALRLRMNPKRFSLAILCDWMCDCTALYMFWISTDVVTVLFDCYMAGVMWNRCCLSTSSVDTVQPCTSLRCHFLWNHICRVHVCLAVTCHLHFWQNDWNFWQNDWELLHATALTQRNVLTRCTEIFFSHILCCNFACVCSFYIYCVFWR